MTSADLARSARYVPRRSSPPDWLDVHPHGVSQPAVSPLTTRTAGLVGLAGVAVSVLRSHAVKTKETGIRRKETVQGSRHAAADGRRLLPVSRFPFPVSIRPTPGRARLRPSRVRQNPASKPRNAARRE